MNDSHIIQISNEFDIDQWKVQSTAALLEEGATVPFIARYRKEKTGSLDEVVITASVGVAGHVDIVGRVEGDVPGLISVDFEVVLAIDDAGDDATRWVSGVDLYAMRHQIPAGHSLDDFAPLGVITHSTDHQRIGVESPEVPGHIERRAPENSAAVRKVIEKHFAENDRSFVKTVHVFSGDVFLGAGGFSPR